MTKKAFDKIADGLREALSVARGERRTTMTNHPTRSNFRYFRVCPRGFANEARYYKVPLDKIAEVDTEYRQFKDEHPGASSGWTTDKKARQPGVAVDWADRNW